MKEKRKLIVYFSTAAMILILLIATSTFFISQQQMTSAKLQDLSMHAAQAADGLRCIAKEPDNSYERYRILFHLQSFEFESKNYWAKAKTANPIPDTLSLKFVSDEYKKENLERWSNILFDVEKELGKLRSNKVITNSQISNTFI